MEILLLGIYAFFVWLIFFKRKWLPWTPVYQAVVITIPIVSLVLLILLLNIVAPSSVDVRVVNYVVQIVPRVSGRVLEVPVQPNQHVKKGQVLFRIDPTPFNIAVSELEAKVGQQEAAVATAEASVRELAAKETQAEAEVEAVEARLVLGQKRVRQFGALVSTGAGSKFDKQQAQTDAANLHAELAASRAALVQIRQRLTAKTSDGEFAEVAAARAQLAQARAGLEQARWELGEATVRAPSDGTVINLQLRPGSYAASLPLTPVISFVEDEQNLIALYKQNELRQVQPGDEAEVALKTRPGHIYKAKVESVVWATAEGQSPLGGTLPNTGATPDPPNRIAVKLSLAGRDEGQVLPAGTRGSGAIYTQRLHAIQILRRVLLRLHSKIDYLIPKLH